MPYPCFESGKNFIVLEDAERTEEALYRVTNHEGGYKDVREFVKEKFTDGLIWIILDDSNWTNEQKREFRRKAIAFTITAPGIKGACQCLLKSDFVTAMTRLGGKLKTHDVYNHIVDFETSGDKVVVFKSSFKWW